ncbi:hypothetical protein DNTS_025915 [Danionella cerebrum]|uniref:Fucosyltransferase n=1 Tax=Danionella cerebrum TaxID=2873325 RepID=A0A553MWX2_9TELE|nr:hypothetical protein DNTS_025915 [Danionella translucida]
MLLDFRRKNAAGWTIGFPQPQKSLFAFFLAFSIFYTCMLLVAEQSLKSSHAPLASNITILLWHWPFNVSYSLSGDVCLRDYGISGCVLADNRRLFESADLVVFHHYELKRHKEQLPLHHLRPANQRWVWLSLEALGTNERLHRFNNIFNLTMSYHPAADITVPYGKLLPRKSTERNFHVAKNKSFEACWVVSNFQNRHKRSAVFRELNKTLNIQLYGRFVKNSLPKEALLPTISRCYFYLAFENAVSPQYITEKLWRNSFQAGTVPIVLGPPRRDYEAIVPSESFIHVDDFQSIQALADYLKGLIIDPERYNAYFRWKQRYTVKLYTDWRERLCNICPIFGRLPSNKVYEDLETWTKQIVNMKQMLPKSQGVQ